MKIRFKNINKNFDKKLVLNNINLSINSGSVYCLLGRNGSGKSTLISLISQLIEPSSGQVTTTKSEKIISSYEMKQKMGLLSQYDTLVEELNVYDFLLFIGLIYKVDEIRLEKNIKKLINYFFLKSEDTTKQIKTYSSGMKKKVQICAAFLHDPEIVLLDEPFSNLDTISCNKLCNLINEFSTIDKIVLVCSHNLNYVNKVATHIGILEGSLLIYNDDLANFKDNGKDNIEHTLLSYIQKDKQEIYLG